MIWPSPTDNSEVMKPGTYTVTGKVPGTTFAPKATVIVKVPVGTITPPSRLAEPFALSDVVLERDTKGRDTPFIRNRDKFMRGLAASNPDNFLYNFRDAFGQPQPAGATQLEGWDNQTTRLRGHASGHYLSAIAQAYASTTYDEALRANFLQKMNYLIDTLYDLSQKSGRPATAGGPSVADPTAVPPGAGRTGYDSNLRTGAIRTDYWNWGAGFISAYPPDQFIMLEKGATYGTQDTQIWAPYYTLHKILAGLLDSYEVAGNKKALDIARGMGAWAYTRLKALPPETRISMWNRYIAGEYGGMNEVMARLFRLTGDKRFLDGAKLFDNTNFFFGNAAHDHGLAKNVDTIRGKHANQHIPQITGALETFRNTKEMPVLPDRQQLLGDRQPQLHVQHRRRGRRADAEQRRVLHRAARHAVAERVRPGRPERDLRDLQPAQARSAAVHVRPDREVHGPLRAGALQPHPRVGGRGRRRQHLPRAAQSRARRSASATRR